MLLNDDIRELILILICGLSLLSLYIWFAIEFTKGTKRVEQERKKFQRWLESLPPQERQRVLDEMAAQTHMDLIALDMLADKLSGPRDGEG